MEMNDMRKKATFIQLLPNVKEDVSPEKTGQINNS